MSQNLNSLNARLQELEADRTQVMAQISGSTSHNQAALDRLSQLGRDISSTSAAIDAENSRIAQLSNPQAGGQGQTVSVQTTVSVGGGGQVGGTDADVSIIAGGKETRRVQVPVGTTLRQIIADIGWQTAGHGFKRRLGPGETADLTQGLDHAFSAGTHELIMVPQVRGGFRK